MSTHNISVRLADDGRRDESERRNVAVGEASMVFMTLN
jgi:hypothetical protein